MPGPDRERAVLRNLEADVATEESVARELGEQAVRTVSRLFIRYPSHCTINRPSNTPSRYGRWVTLCHTSRLPSYSLSTRYLHLAWLSHRSLHIQDVDDPTPLSSAYQPQPHSIEMLADTCDIAHAPANGPPIRSQIAGRTSAIFDGA